MGRVFSQTFVSTPPFSVPPYYTSREHEFRRTTVAAALAYQFLENRWVHPFLGVGVEGVRELEEIETQLVPTGGPRGSGPGRETRVRYSARPFISGGVKWYASERSFIRTDVLTTFSSGGAESSVWRIGVGVDF